MIKINLKVLINAISVYEQKKCTKKIWIMLPTKNKLKKIPVSVMKK